MVLSDFWFLVAFTVVIVGLLVVDLVVINRDMGAPNMRQSALWCAFWVSLALLFSVYVFISRGRTAGLEFLTGYIIEYSLSVDNLFVFFMLFTYFAVPAAYQRRVLFWGILGAFLMRGTMIALGAALIKQFHWILYLFGAFLVFTGFKMLRSGDEEVEPEKNPVVRFARQRLPITPSYVGEKFFVRQGRALLATPLFIVLLSVETTDLVFAVDSIPAIFAVTQDPFIVYTSNVFAILGLRSLYFLLRDMATRFHYLKIGLSVVLMFIGVKMLVMDIFKIPTELSLAVVATVLSTSVVVSILRPPAEPHELPVEHAAEASGASPQLSAGRAEE